MEFTLVTSHEGTTFQQNMSTMDIIYVHPEYLVHLNCESVEEYMKSIVHASMNIPQDMVQKALRDEAFCSLHGSIVFRHIRTRQTAIVSFKSEHVRVEHPDKIAPYQVCVTKVNSIQWQNDNKCTEWLAHVEAKLSLCAAEHAIVCRDEHKYISVCAMSVPDACDVSSELRTLQCKVDVVEESRRVHLLHKSLFDAPLLPECEHSGEWCIITLMPHGNDAFIVEMSSLMRDNFASCPSSLTCLRELLEANQTSAQVNRVFSEIVPDIVARNIGDVGEYTTKFIRRDAGFRDMALKIMKTRTLYIMFV